tara:strand:+ start:1692 stop:1907 length:216 start_codon:yes stop_codon:yes gene_type:complete
MDINESHHPRQNPWLFAKINLGLGKNTVRTAKLPQIITSAIDTETIDHQYKPLFQQEISDGKLHLHIRVGV